ncbi:hypothetical protein Nepgr_006381 [Nepenthes gracilis]|uniref:Uncharacterized protein n=1 Tax=Nepenthes gracilis TaxID=150966 RepID=A0AAD3S532_NEPGR|nr:hypothetical protein Nepgr_006381 [Nepenthes gracilis]
MENPFDHHHRRHHHRPDEEEDYPPPSHFPSDADPYYQQPPAYPSPFDQPPPPPPRYGAYEQPPHPPPRPAEVTNVYHSSYESADYPPPSYSQHTSHISHAPPQEEEHHHFRPHVPSFIQSHIHSHTHEDQGPGFANKPSVRVYSKAETNYSLAIRDGHVILARSNPSDPNQHWIKDEKYSTRVKDEEGFPSFALVNKATGQAMKHSIGATKPVQLIPYNQDALDESILWTESRDLGDGFRTIRMVTISGGRSFLIETCVHSIRSNAD